MTWREALIWGKNMLLEAGIPDGDWDAEQMFLFAVGCDRTKLLLNGGAILSSEQEQSYRELIEKRKDRVPLQHLTGEQEFMGLPFYVNQDVLIPRQDTECLVEAVLRHLEAGSFQRMQKSEEMPTETEEACGIMRKTDKIRILDLCTGSGCIGISLGKLAGKGVHGMAIGEQRDAQKESELLLEVVCSDISSRALDVAKRNASRNGVEITWIESDLFEHISGKFHVIVSNPPYITKAEMDELMPEVRLFEPEGALYGMEDGLYFYREIIRQAPEYLEENGMLFFEIGCCQGREVSGLMKEAGFQDIRIEKDLAGLNRILYGRI